MPATLDKDALAAAVTAAIPDVKTAITPFTYMGISIVNHVTPAELQAVAQAAASKAIQTYLDFVAAPKV